MEKPSKQVWQAPAALDVGLNSKGCGSVLGVAASRNKNKSPPLLGYAFAATVWCAVRWEKNPDTILLVAAKVEKLIRHVK